MERELRKGNLVKGIGINIQWTVEGIHDGFIFSSGHWRVLTSFEPIPLTEEWAEKFDFENLVELAEYFCSESRYPIGITSEDLKAMKVHEAQNLFFLLTGEEL